MDNVNGLAKEAVEKLNKEMDKCWDEARYTKSIVAFLDIMVTKSMVLGERDNFNAHKIVYKTWDKIMRRHRLNEYSDYVNELYGVRCVFVFPTYIKQPHLYERGSCNRKFIS